MIVTKQNWVWFSYSIGSYKVVVEAIQGTKLVVRISDVKFMMYPGVCNSDVRKFT